MRACVPGVSAVETAAEPPGVSAIETAAELPGVRLALA
jgi:hypothetical protein